MPRNNAIFTTVQPESTRFRASAKPSKAVMPLAVWQEVKRRCKAVAGLHKVDDEVQQPGRDCRVLARALRQVLSESRCNAQLRVAVEGLVGLADLGLGVKLTLVDAATLPDALQPVPEAPVEQPELPEGDIYRPRPT